MFMSFLVVIGIFSYMDLGVDQFPPIDFPMARIFARLPGASAEELETEVAKPIEEAVNSISGIEQISTTCMFETVQIMVKFNMNKSADMAAQEVRERVSQIQAKFPKGMDAPQVGKLDPGAQPVITYVVSADMPIRDLTQFASKKLKEPLETLNGIGSVRIVGGVEREIRVELDPVKMNAYKISPVQVKAALIGQNAEIPGGNVTSGDREYVLRTLGRLESVGEFANIVVATPNNVPVRIADIGRIVDGEEEARSLARMDGKTCISVIVQKQSGVNAVEVTDQVKKRLEGLKPMFPKGVEITALRDNSRFIRNSLHELSLHLVLGAILASLAVLVFMGNYVSTLIAAISIPISIVSTFSLMEYMGFTMNGMSMLGLTLAVGIVIDDAIVVLENIFRHIEEKGSDPMKAASEGTSEIYLAVMATSLSLAVIFIPVAFIEGIIGRILKHFGLTMAFSILISIVVSLTLIPMLCSRLFKYKFARGGGHSKSSKFYSAIDGLYGWLLRLSMKHRAATVAVAFLCIAAIFPLGKFVKIDFVPADDTNEYTIFFRTPEGTSLAGTEKILKEIEDKAKKIKGVEHVFSTIAENEGSGVNEGSIFIQLVDISKRPYSVFDSMDEARKVLTGYDRYKPVVQASAGVGGTGKNWDVSMAVKGPNLDKIRGYADKIVEKIKNDPMISAAESSALDRKPEIQVKIDRQRAFRSGVDIESLAYALRTMVGGVDNVNQFKQDDEMYEIRVRLGPEYRKDPAAIKALSFQNREGKMIRLDAIATIMEGFGATQIDRQDRQRSVTVNANMTPLGAVNEVNKLMEAAARDLKMPAEYSFGLLGRSGDMDQTINGFIKAFLLSAIFMYMILASQFESLLHPVTIMLSLPLSIPFALFSLLVTGNSLNIFSALGVFMLFGIVKKNSILQIDYTNTLREAGMPRYEAIITANHARLRPILMTTVTLIVSMIPMALGTGAGSGTRASLAIVIIGGQTLCLLITLLLTPVAYSLFDDVMEWIRAKTPKFEQ
jgi:HAE1 family hydrophobic/amphiphilic exporter-1